MKIYINGKQLDTYAKSVSVKKTNNLWKFGKAEFERTQTISVPATNNNKALLDFADEFRTQSSVARGYVDCLTELDGVVKPARLYVSGYKGGEFSCILTFGKELEILDKKLSEFIDKEMFVLIGSAGYEIIRAYDKDGVAQENAFISSSLIMNLIKNSVTDVINFSDFNAGYAGLLTEYGAHDMDKIGVDYYNSITRLNYGGISTSESSAKLAYETRINGILTNYKKTTAVPYIMEQRGYVRTGQIISNGYARFEYFQVPADIDLVFGAGCEEYSVIFLDRQYLDLGNGGLFYHLIRQQFGKYIDFTHGYNNYTYTDGDLSNAKIRVPAYTPFIVCDASDYYWNTQDDDYTYTGGLYSKNINTSFNLTARLPTINISVMPDITLYQFLQMICAANGVLMYFDGTKYRTTNLGNIYNTVFDTKIISAGSFDLSDKAFGFARNNVIKYKEGDVSISYKIDNLHISEEKTIFEIPFGSGETYKDSVKATEKFPLYVDVRYGETADVLPLTKNAYFEAILANTRQVKIKFRMSYLDFDDVAELDCFRYKGALLQWVDLTWSDGWCTATLQTV